MGLNWPSVRHELNQGFVIWQAGRAQFGNKGLGHIGILPNRPLVPAVINVGVAESAGGTHNGTTLRIEKSRARRQVFGQIAIVFQTLLVASSPGSNTGMIAHIAYERIIKLRGP